MKVTIAGNMWSLNYFSLQIVLHICACVVCVHAYICVYMYVVKRLMSSVFLNHPLPYILRHGFLLEPRVTKLG